MKPECAVWLTVVLTFPDFIAILSEETVWYYFADALEGV